MTDDNQLVNIEVSPEAVVLFWELALAITKQWEAAGGERTPKEEALMRYARDLESVFFEHGGEWLDGWEPQQARKSGLVETDRDADIGRMD